MKYKIFGIFLMCFSLHVKCQNLIVANFLTTICKDSLNNLFPGLPLEYDVNAYYILYSTVDGRGDSTVASGLCLVPDTDSCNFFPLISYQHGTILEKSDVPSRLNGESLVCQFFSSLGNIVLCPDYVGLGDGPGLHPYLHAKSQATATIDLIRAARQFLNDSLQIYDNGQVFLIGASQGGHATMSTHKYIEENNLLSEIQIVASAPSSGPYQISGAQTEMILNTPDYGMPSYVIYVLFAYNDVYQNIFSDPLEVLLPPYNVTIPPLLNGNHSLSELNDALPDSLHLFLNPTFLQSVIDDMDEKQTPFWQNLIDNDVYNWAPTVPVRMYYCQADEQVTYLNSINALNAMLNAGAVDVQAININPTASHGHCSFYSVYDAYVWFHSKRIPCYENTTVSNIQETVYRLFPNPASDKLYLEGIGKSYSVICMDVKGNIIGNWKEIHNGIDISALASGLYVFQLMDDKKTPVFWSKILVIQ